jgi:hypothetical protein
LIQKEILFSSPTEPFIRAQGLNNLHKLRNRSNRALFSGNRNSNVEHNDAEALCVPPYVSQ